MNYNKSVLFDIVHYIYIHFIRELENGLYMFVNCEGILDSNFISLLVSVRINNAIFLTI